MNIQSNKRRLKNKTKLYKAPPPILFLFKLALKDSLQVASYNTLCSNLYQLPSLVLILRHSYIRNPLKKIGNYFEENKTKESNFNKDCYFDHRGITGHLEKTTS